MSFPSVFSTVLALFYQELGVIISAVVNAITKKVVKRPGAIFQA